MMLSARDVAIIHLPSIDSTNNYAMHLIDAEAAEEGLTIVADAQTAGKGQRGNTWADTAGESLLMSVILRPTIDLTRQFILSAAVAVTIAEILMDMSEHWDVRIKWPNDIIINDRKAGGILIENVLRGQNWAWCVTGIGLNVKQPGFPPTLPFATSIKIESGEDAEVMKLARDIAAAVISININDASATSYLDRYNNYLYKRNQQQCFVGRQKEEWVTILEAADNGLLKVQTGDGRIASYTHGAQEWKWGA